MFITMKSLFIGHQGMFYFLLISLVCLVCFADGAVEFGASCGLMMNKEPCDYGYKCVDFRCHCDESSYELVYTREGAPICSFRTRGIASILGNISTNDTCYPKCTVKQECLKERCVCIEGYVKSQFDSLCHKVVYAKPMNICEVKENAILCDPSSSSICVSSRCLCFKNYYYNFTRQECLLKQSGNKSLYNEYCRASDDCLEGLRCSDDYSYRCKCPTSCPYSEEFGACDCGKVSVESPVMVIVVGCISGICSVIFWIWCINKTSKKPGYESDSNDIGEDNHLDDIPPVNGFPVVQSNPQDAQPNFHHDGPPSYKEALSGTPSAQMGFCINNASNLDAAITNKNSDIPYVPYFPPAQNNYLDSQTILPYATSGVNPTASDNLPYPTSDVNPTAPSLVTGHPTNLTPIPYPVSPQMQTHLVSTSSSTAPYPLSP